MRHISNDRFFDMNWDELVVQQGNTGSNYWIGLERLSQLTIDRPYRLRIELTATNDALFTLDYATFQVGPADTNYWLTVSDYDGLSPLPGDALNQHSGVGFTTKDRDNDENPSDNTAQQLGGAWWYKTGCRACLTTSPGVFLAWILPTSGSIQLKEVTMSLMCR